MQQNSVFDSIEEPEVRLYIDLIRRALANVRGDFYRVITTYEKHGIPRERVFCYELYHQMRIIMEQHSYYERTLHGEIDKKGHHDILDKDQRNPDFVIHVPGLHAGNTLIVEVKGRLDSDYYEAVEKDFKTLLTFVTHYQYRAGVFILFGHTLKNLIVRMRERLRALQQDPSAKHVYILCKRDFSHAGDEARLSDLILDT